MENLNFIDPLLHGIIPDELEKNSINISTKQLVCAGIGTLIAGAVLKKAGHQKTAALVSGFALPLFASALYKKFGSRNNDKSQSDDYSFYDYDERGHA